MPVGAREEIQLAELSSDRNAGFRLKAAATPQQISRRSAPLARQTRAIGTTEALLGFWPYAACRPRKSPASRHCLLGTARDKPPDQAVRNPRSHRRRPSERQNGRDRSPRSARELEVRLPSTNIAQASAVYPLDAAGAFVNWYAP